MSMNPPQISASRTCSTTNSSRAVAKDAEGRKVKEDL